MASSSRGEAMTAPPPSHCGETRTLTRSSTEGGSQRSLRGQPSASGSDATPATVSSGSSLHGRVAGLSGVCEFCGARIPWRRSGKIENESAELCSASHGACGRGLVPVLAGCQSPGWESAPRAGPGDPASARLLLFKSRQSNFCGKSPFIFLLRNEFLPE